MASSWRHTFFYQAHALVQRIIFKTCGRSRPHLLYFSKYKRSKSGHFRWYNYHYLSIYVQAQNHKGCLKLTPFLSSQFKKCFKNLFSQKNDLLPVSDDSESIWAKTIFLNFWWNTRLRLTMDAILYIHFLNPLTFRITG